MPPGGLRQGGAQAAAIRFPRKQLLQKQCSAPETSMRPVNSRFDACFVAFPAVGVAGMQRRSHARQTVCKGSEQDWTCQMSSVPLRLRNRVDHVIADELVHRPQDDTHVDGRGHGVDLRSMSPHSCNSRIKRRTSARATSWSIPYISRSIAAMASGEAHCFSARQINAPGTIRREQRARASMQQSQAVFVRGRRDARR